MVTIPYRNWGDYLGFQKAHKDRKCVVQTFECNRDAQDENGDRDKARYRHPR